MLDAKVNRLDYGEELIPPDSSYELDFAVGTTYSLDLGSDHGASRRHVLFQTTRLLARCIAL